MPKTHGQMVPLRDIVSTFNIRINSKSFPWTVRCAPERDLPKISATFVVVYCPIVRYSADAGHGHKHGSGAA